MSRSTRGVYPAIVLVCAVAAAPSQVQGVERRLERLEAESRERAALEARVRELETKLAVYESGETPASARLDQEKSQRLSIGGQFRARFEYRDPFDYRLPGTFGRPGTDVFGGDDDRVEQRTRLHVEARASEHVRAFVELQDSRLWGFESSVVSDSKNVDLHQGFVDLEGLFGEPLTLRVGRQKLSFGDQRMVSPLDWSNVSRSWDGARLLFRPENWEIDFFLTQIGEAAALASPGLSGDDRTFGGLYASYRGHAAHEYDLYVMHRRTHDGTVAAESGALGDGDDWWVGARAKGVEAEGAFDWTAEGVFQFGDRAGDDVSGFGSAVTAGYTFKDAASLRLGVEWTYATGDETPGDGDVDRFEAPFPFGHNYQGWADVFSWKNGHDFAFHASIKPSSEWTVGASLHYFVLDEDRDAWFNAAGGGLRRDMTGAAGDEVGTELDLYAKWTVRPQVVLFFGYSRFFAGTFVENTGPAPDQDWIFFMVTADF
jgi:hypothetical protein